MRKRQPPTQVAYILELEGGNYYVGITANIMRRMGNTLAGMALSGPNCTSLCGCFMRWR